MYDVVEAVMSRDKIIDMAYSKQWRWNQYLHEINHLRLHANAYSITTLKP